MLKHIMFLSVSLMILSSCAGMFPHRTYQEVMDDEPVAFFSPRDDFRVIPGDSGKAYRTREDVLKRTPASSYDEQLNTYNLSLRDELFHLERMQNEYAKRQYMANRDKFASDSERIYFLKIDSMREREEYLRQKGFISDNAQFTNGDFQMAHYQGEVLLGMTKEQVLQSIGRPIRRDIAGEPKYENERWAFLLDGKTHFIYFERGRVEGWSSNPF